MNVAQVKRQQAIWRWQAFQNEQVSHWPTLASGTHEKAESWIAFPKTLVVLNMIHDVIHAWPGRRLGSLALYSRHCCFSLGQKFVHSDELFRHAVDLN